MHKPKKQCFQNELCGAECEQAAEQPFKIYVHKCLWKKLAGCRAVLFAITKDKKKHNFTQKTRPCTAGEKQDFVAHWASFLCVRFWNPHWFSFLEPKDRVLCDRGLGRGEAEAGKGVGGVPARVGMRRAGAGRLGRAGLGCSTTKKGHESHGFRWFFLIDVSSGEKSGFG